MAALKGDDYLVGGLGPDTFVFNPNYGDEIIAEFDLTNFADMIDLTAISNISNMADVNAAAFDDGTNTTIATSATSSIILIRVLKTDLSEANGMFI